MRPRRTTIVPYMIGGTASIVPGQRVAGYSGQTIGEGREIAAQLRCVAE
jgi:hypothetical protein